MEIKIGIRDVVRETTLDVDLSVEEVVGLFTRARADDGLLTLNDVSGRQVVIPASGVGYLEFGQEHARPVGFGTTA